MGRLFAKDPSRNGAVEFSDIPRLILNRKEFTAYFGRQYVSVKGKLFKILCKLAERPGNIVTHQELYSLIESEFHKDPLLRQYISSIRSAFPPPYSNPRHQESIIKTRKMEGYYLDLPPYRVEII
jgi:DNA-binding response OmpR family regulator